MFFAFFLPSVLCFGFEPRPPLKSIPTHGHGKGVGTRTSTCMVCIRVRVSVRVRIWGTGIGMCKGKGTGKGEGKSQGKGKGKDIMSFRVSSCLVCNPKPFRGILMHPGTLYWTLGLGLVLG
jgi:hypothetical protein